MAVLLTRPRHDTATHYLYHWAGELIRVATERKVDLVDLAKGKAKKKAIQSYLAKNVCDVVLINGHGDAVSVCGHDDEVIIAVDDGDDLFKDKIVFIRSCESGAVLGQAIIRKGAKGFVGYVQPYIIPFQEDSFHDPLKDEFAQPILESSNQVGISLLKGRTSLEAHADSLKKYDEKMDELLTSGKSMTFLIPFLQWNRDFQIAR